MTNLTKPSFASLWASAGSKTEPDSTKITAGWILEKPKREYMNWLENRQDQMLAYIDQHGIPEWDTDTEYQDSISYVQYNGDVYKCLQTNAGQNPATATAYWGLAFDDAGSAATVQSNLTTHISNYGVLASLSNKATARTNLEVYSKTESDLQYAQIDGDSTQTFEVATATASTHAVPKSQMDAAISAIPTVSYATQGEVDAGTLTNKTISPATLHGYVDPRTPVAIVSMNTSGIIADILGNVTFVSYAHDTGANSYRYRFSVAGAPTFTNTTVVAVASGSFSSYGPASVVSGNTIDVTGFYPGNEFDANDNNISVTLYAV